MLKIPKTGFKGLIENWQSDLLASVSVALVALPLGLGIAIASEAPPMTGVISAIVGGIVTTFFRGSHLAINGPAAGLIAVILGSLLLWQGDPNALNYVLAVIVVSGVLQVILGFLKLGIFAEIFHSSVIHGILAAIGIIIFAKQIHYAMGTTTLETAPIAIIIDAFKQIPNINPFVAVISLAGLLLLIFQSKLSFKLFHVLPAPMWVLVISIPFVYLFGFMEEGFLNFLGKDFKVGPSQLVDIPDNLWDAIAYPNFSQIGTWKFWSSVISLTIIASLQTLAMAKAVDKLDPYKRKTNLNKDLIGVGLATIVSGAIGGLPIITVIVRSTVNVHNHAKTKWSNFYHGLLLLMFIFLLSPVITKVPLAALAVLLVFTGYKLAAPRVFMQVLDKGIEQFIFFVGTLVITLLTDLLFGIFGGLLLALLTHMLLARVTARQFFDMIYNSGSNLFMNPDGTYELKIKGIANFLGALKMNKFLNEVPAGSQVNINLSETRLVGYSVLEKLYDFQRTHALTEGTAEITGLDNHISSTSHKLGLKLFTTSALKMTTREVAVSEIAEKFEWDYRLGPIDHKDFYSPFYFFQSRPIDEVSNCISSRNQNLYWEIADVTFEEGASLAYSKYKTTLGLIRLSSRIPKFTIEKKELLDKYIALPSHKDIDYVTYTDFSDKFIVKAESKEELDAFLTEELKTFLTNESVTHIESCGDAILFFPSDFRLTHVHEYSHVIKYLNDLMEHLSKRLKA